MTRAPEEDQAGRDLSIEEAFELVGNAQRIKILRALWESPDEAVPFSELRARAGVDDSGQFNYHLEKLLGTFVRKTAAGYVPRRTGMTVIRALLASTTDHQRPLDGASIDGSCAFCDGGLTARYEAETAVVRCDGCGKVQLREWLPPAVFADRDDEAVVRAMDRWVRHRTAMVIDGVCPDCGGRPRQALFESRTARGESRDYLRASYVCGTCAYECDVPVWLHVLFARHPPVTAFYHARGVDLEARPTWDITRLGRTVRVLVESDDPRRIRVEIPLDDDVLYVWLDGSLALVGASEREAARLAVDD